MEDREGRIGYWVSGVAHGSLILWAILGGALFRPQPDHPVRTTQVSTVSGAEFEAMAAAARGAGPVGAEATAVASLPDPVDPSEDGAARPVDAAPPQTSQAEALQTPDAAEAQPDLSDFAPATPVDVVTDLPAPSANQTAGAEAPPAMPDTPAAPLAEAQPAQPAPPVADAPAVPVAPRSVLALDASPRPQDRPAGLVEAFNRRVAQAEATRQAELIAAREAAEAEVQAAEAERQQAANAAAEAERQAAADAAAARDAADAEARRQAADAAAEAAAAAERQAAAAEEAARQAAADAAADQEAAEAARQAAADAAAEQERQAAAEAEAEAEHQAAAEAQAEAERLAAAEAAAEAERQAAAEAAEAEAARQAAAAAEAEAERQAAAEAAAEAERQAAAEAEAERQATAAAEAERQAEAQRQAAAAEAQRQAEAAADAERQAAAEAAARAEADRQALEDALREAQSGGGGQDTASTGETPGGETQMIEGGSGASAGLDPLAAAMAAAMAGTGASADPANDPSGPPADMMRLTPGPIDSIQATPLDDPGAGLPMGDPLTLSERDGLRFAIQNCWNLGALSVEASQMTVSVGFTLSPNGLPDQDSLRLAGYQGGSETAAQQAFEVARRAILMCGRAGFELPASKYGRWRDVVVDFRPGGVAF